MKKFLSLLLSAVLIFSLFAFPASAASATFTLSGAGSVTVGGNVTVGVKLSGSEKIGSWRFSLTYDPAVLEYVSGADSGGGGAVLFSDSSDGTTTLTRNVVFRARKIGTTTLSISGAQVVSFESVSNMQISSASKKIEVTAAPTMSGENNLSALTLSQGELSPAFDPKTTSYTLTVPFEVASLVFTATPKDKTATVSVTGAEELAVGENTVTVVVTAQNGAKKTYTILVTRQESELSGGSVTLGDKAHTIAYDPATLQAPEGYTSTTAAFGDKKILAYASPQNTILICYLYMDSVEDGAWYVYNEKSGEFTPYLSLSSGVGTFVILTPEKGVKLPEGYEETTLAVGEKEITAYKNKNSKEKVVYLVYAMSSDGTLSFYYYDTSAGSFVTYFETESGVSKETQKEMDRLSKSLKQAEKKAKIFLILSLSVGIVAVILLLSLVIVLILTKKKKETPPAQEEELLSVMEEIPPFEESVTPAPVKKRRARRTIEKTIPSPEELFADLDKEESTESTTEE